MGSRICGICELICTTELVAFVDCAGGDNYSGGVEIIIVVEVVNEWLISEG